MTKTPLTDALVKKHFMKIGEFSVEGEFAALCAAMEQRAVEAEGFITRLASEPIGSMMMSVEERLDLVVEQAREYVAKHKKGAQDGKG